IAFVREHKYAETPAQIIPYGVYENAKEDDVSYALIDYLYPDVMDRDKISYRERDERVDCK
ncbi:MAG: hypothetical protein Q4G59_08840, partial [Planctomycetia bacterium]|nr:hypothetical protein [Planctomycetia bacterium]